MNILVVEGEASNSLGGAEISMFSYIRHLSSLDNNIYLTYQKSGDWLNENNSKYFKETVNINIDSFTSQGIFSFIKNLSGFVSFNKKNSIDVILTHTIHGFLFLRMANFFLRKPIAVYFKWVYTKPSIGFLNKMGIKVVDKAAFLPSVENYWVKNGLRENIKTLALYNGLKISDINISSEAIFNNKNKICYFGRITKGKGVHLLIEAIAELSHLSLSIYGRYDEKDRYYIQLCKLINEKQISDRVKFKGFTMHPMNKMLEYGLVVVPSISYEAQGRVLFEAMFTKTMVIATDNGGMPKILGEYKEQLIFQPDVNSLIDKLKDIQNMSQNAKDEIKLYLFNRFMNNYTEEKTHLKLDEFLFNS